MYETIFVLIHVCFEAHRSERVCLFSEKKLVGMHGVTTTHCYHTSDAT